MTVTEYVCNLCPGDEPYSNTERKHTKRHITMLADAYHEGRNGADAGVIRVVGEEDVEEPGAGDGGRVRTELGNAAFEGEPIDATMTPISERPHQPSGGSAETDDGRMVVALDDSELVEIFSADCVSDETKRSLLNQIRGGW